MEPISNDQASVNMMEGPARPQFLSVLCILTWVCAGLLFISTLWSALFPPSPEQKLEQIEKMREISPERADQMEAFFESQDSSKQIMTNVLALIALALSAYGAYMMWQLKKTGFYVYLGGELLPYVGFLFGGAEPMKAMGQMFGMGDAFLVIAISVMALFDAIFIAMYAVNLKHMR